MVIAVTGDDEDNLVICQMAKSRFHVQRTIARVNNPRNDELFLKLLAASRLGGDVCLTTCASFHPRFTASCTPV